MVTDSKDIVVRQPEAFALPEVAEVTGKLKAIKAFQDVVHANLVQKHDYGIIPGTDKPTLLKPGAEKIAKLLGLSDEYEIVDRQENWEKGFFRYLIRCKLVSMQSGVLVSTGLGECNSFETKYRYRWVYQSGLPAEYQGDNNKAARDRLVTRSIKTKNGPTKQYRLDNDEIFSIVNTILKMAKKRALVDASLSAGRLSDVFTQDMEDIVPVVDEPDEGVIGEIKDNAPMGVCPVHKKPFIEGQYGWYCKSRSAEGTWCKEKPKLVTPDPEQAKKDTEELFGSNPQSAAEATQTAGKATPEQIKALEHIRDSKVLVLATEIAEHGWTINKMADFTAEQADILIKKAEAKKNKENKQ